MKLPKHISQASVDFVNTVKRLMPKEFDYVVATTLETEVQKAEKRTEYAEKLLDDVVCLYVKNLEDDTSLMKRVRSLMKKRLDEGKSVTAAWGWLDDRGRLSHNKEEV